MQSNPLIERIRVTKYNVFPLDSYKLEHFEPAAKLSIEEAEIELQIIKDNKETPNFENTIFALETTGELMSDVASVFFNLLSTHSDNEFKALAQVLSPMFAKFGSQLSTDAILFAKVKAVYDNMDKLGLNSEQKRLTELKYKGFVRNGAMLDDAQKKQLMEIDMEQSKISPMYSQNVLNSTNAYSLLKTNKDELKGIPVNALKAAAYLAKQKGHDEGWMFNLQGPSLMPVLTYADNRELRKTISLAAADIGNVGEFDNKEHCKRITELRFKRANILGFGTHADYVLAERMAENKETVINFLEDIYQVAYPVAKAEVAEVAAFAKELDGIEDFMAWDFSYYSEKLKQKKFKFNSEELRPYFKVENVIDGVFKVANKLYGLQFKALNDIPVYHEDVKVFEVSEANNDYVGLLYVDLHPRETKRSGAWMNPMVGQGFQSGKMVRPQIFVVANFTPSTGDTPSLLTFREVETMFHEFGHALHGLLSDVTYASIASPSVYWDFVELPSQIMENWVSEKEALELFAFHYETGEVIPAELIEKIKAASTYLSGYNNVRQLSFGFLDMAWHSNDPTAIEDVVAFEDEVFDKTKLFPKVTKTSRSASFGHIFAGGYSSGYYSYKWAEVLDADAFSLFKEKGIFDKETAESFRRNVLAKGNTVHPMELFKAFRGRTPDADALLRRDGLLK
ncbi:MAG: M3 family metallopeptidase [Candidatus Zophobacter franzmannii]|nr:M3 family metallopeptidase [Candidatus Zophobacter franzmannii]